ncbi:hypothetical protein tinsulaeT_25480 [Thalassotalea insulae]|uniref:Putative DNA-binding domain-containing protein n=1 Tax=Thalassotalea insulae TaxID=2056778 RepID=A0ABQ6GTC8_9GAMM|nr:DNA-binding domain-containing protein [Thalassotalea insulae]GLX79208.1 hypothetical protein tinsulaeT_25480 [Thalassotalea insulae]
MSETNLARQQHWFLQMMLSGNALESHANPYVQDSEHFPATSRLFVYQQGYRLRLLECMQAEFPALHLYLGETLFSMFVFGYLQRRPSSHYSLYELGADFADFLATTCPSSQQVPDNVARYLTLPQQLAEVERARSCALRNAGCEELKQYSSITEIVPLSWPSIQLPATSLIVSVGYDLFNYIMSADNYLAEDKTHGTAYEKPKVPEICQQTLLVYRHRYRVSIALLKPWQAAVLTALQSAQQNQQSLNNEFWYQVAKKAQLSSSALLAELNNWLPKALSSSQVC